MKQLCSIPDCGGHVQARGLCNFHYGRMRRAERPRKPRENVKVRQASLDNLRPNRSKDSPKPPHPANIPAFQEFLSSRDTSARDERIARLQNEARAQGRPGGIVSWQEIGPDPRDKPEVVRLGRVPGTMNFRRV